ncbi:hypothetical protein RJ639_027900, partial [Escallonia herrerae]
MTKKNYSSSSSSSSSVQALYDLCKKTFTPSASPTASPQAIHKLSSLLGDLEMGLDEEGQGDRHMGMCVTGRSGLADTFGPANVGLKKENQEDDRGYGPFGLSLLNRVDRWAQPITYVDMHECESFTMCIFCFPTSSVVPLHDHPGMTVLSKVLYGSLHVKAYDWVEPTHIQKSMGTGHSPVRLAKLAVDEVLTAPCGTRILYPKSGGNLHSFTAVTPCAVLDILAPPYHEPAGRKCTYYHDYPYSSFPTGIEGEISDAKEDYAWLAETEPPRRSLYAPGRIY